jgi:threonine dehydratase
MKTPQLPVPELAKKLGLTNELWFKREDLHHHGSHKGRSIPLMVTDYYKKGTLHFVISSSGNAALSAINAVQTRNKNNPPEPLTLQVYVGPHVETKKLEKLKRAISEPHITIEQVQNPKQTCFKIEKEGKAKFLRQSTDDLALRGYTDLAKELAKIPDLSAVFIPTSSGTTAQGLAIGFEQAGINPELHIVQTTSCHPIVDAILKELGSELLTTLPEPSLASAIVDKIALRKNKVVEAVIKSKGTGWIITNQEIQEAMNLVKTTTEISISPTSALSVAALIKAQKNNRTFSGSIVCLITGA